MLALEWDEGRVSIQVSTQFEVIDVTALHQVYPNSLETEEHLICILKIQPHV